jgi:hypothetical protein
LATDTFLKSFLPHIRAAPATATVGLIFDWLSHASLPDCLQPAFPDSSSDLLSNLNCRRIFMSGSEAEKLFVLLAQLPTVLKAYTSLPRLFSDFFNPKDMMDQISRPFCVIPDTSSLDILTRVSLLENFLIHADNRSIVDAAILCTHVADRVTSILPTTLQHGTAE